jgi:hypothetical protein
VGLVNIAGIAALVVGGWFAFGLIWFGIHAVREWINPPVSQGRIRHQDDLWFGVLFILVGVSFFAAIEQIATGAIK